VAGDCPGWVARLPTVSDASFSKNTSHAIAPARQPLCLNDKGLAPMASAMHRIDADGEEG
jgi:hypothetical protein